MSVAIQKKLFTVEEYHAMGEAGILREQGIELIQGEIIEMSPIGSRHAKTVNKLNHLLNRALGDSYIISIQNPVITDQFSEPEPDVAILQFREDFYGSAHPTGKDVHLIIEVADHSFSYDQEIKLPLYARAGIPEYWIVDIGHGRIHAYWLPAGEVYRFSQIVQSGDKLSAQNLPVSLAVGDIF